MTGLGKCEMKNKGYLGHRLALMGVDRKQPTHGNSADTFSSSPTHHFGPITSGGSMKMTLFAGISRVATK